MLVLASVCVCSCIDLQYVRMFEHSFFFRLEEILHAAQVSVMDHADIFQDVYFDRYFFLSFISRSHR